MNKFFQFMGILTLICFSFFYTEKTSMVVREYDEIMKQIKEVAPSKTKEPIEAIIIDDKIIPGKPGMQVNINKSYYKMKQYGKYEETLLVYQEIKPTIEIKDNLEKYVIKGNDSDKKIGLLFLVDDVSVLDKTLEILKNTDTKATFFLERQIVENDEQIISKILALGYGIGSLDFETKYETKSFSWMNVLIKKRQGHNYCYTKEENEEILNNCVINKNPTIMPKHYLFNTSIKK